MKGWGPKSLACPSKPRKTRLFGRDIPGFAGISRWRPKSLRKTSLCLIFSPYGKLKSSDSTCQQRDTYAVCTEKAFIYRSLMFFSNCFPPKLPMPIPIRNYFENRPISGRRKKRRILSRLWLPWLLRSRWARSKKLSGPVLHAIAGLSQQSPCCALWSCECLNMAKLGT